VHSSSVARVRASRRGASAASSSPILVVVPNCLSCRLRPRLITPRSFLRRPLTASRARRSIARPHRAGSPGLPRDGLAHRPRVAPAPPNPRLQTPPRPRRV
jgi:hypothetical protein